MHPIKDSHKTIRHGTAPQQTKLSRVACCILGRASGLQKVAPVTSKNHSCSPIWGAGIQDYTRFVVTTKQTTHIHVIHTRKLYTDYTGIFPVRSRSVNQYVMLAYHYSNVILVAHFKTRKEQHRLSAYNSIMKRLNNWGLTTDLHILDNEESQNYKETIRDKLVVDLQLVPPDTHRINASERAIRIFKVHFLAVLSWVEPDFP